MNKAILELVGYWAEYRNSISKINFELLESDKYIGIRPFAKPSFIDFMDFLRTKL